MNWYKEHFIKTARGNSLLTKMVTLYALFSLANDDRFKNYYSSVYKIYLSDVKSGFLEEVYRVSINRIERVCDRIANPEDYREEELISSDIIQNNHPELWNIIISGNPNSYLRDLGSIKSFYSELHSDDINAVYPRGERNNAPWIEIIKRAIILKRTRGEDVMAAIDGLKNAVHNTGESVVDLMKDGREIIEFFNITKSSDQNVLLQYMLRHVDRSVVDARDLNMVLRGTI